MRARHKKTGDRETETEKQIQKDRDRDRDRDKNTTYSEMGSLGSELVSSLSDKIYRGGMGSER